MLTAAAPTLPWHRMHRHSKVLVFLALGLLPMWIGLLMLVLSPGETQDQRQHAWFFLTVLVVIGCPVSLAMTAAGFLAFALAGGGQVRRWVMAAIATAVAALLAAVVLAGWQADRPGVRAADDRATPRLPVLA